MDSEEDLLLASAARLYSLGVDLETAREQLRQLVERGVPYSSEEMQAAYQKFVKLDRYWKELEKQHLELRDELM